MTWLDLLTVAQDAAPVLSALVFVALLYLGTKFVSHRRCAEHRELAAADQKRRIAGSDERRVALEAVIKELPSSDDIAGLENSITELRGEMKTLAATMKGQAALIRQTEGNVTLILQHLMEAS